MAELKKKKFGKTVNLKMESHKKKNENKKVFTIACWQIELKKKAGGRGHGLAGLKKKAREKWRWAVNGLVGDAKKRIAGLQKRVAELKEKAALLFAEKAVAFEKRKGRERAPKLGAFGNSKIGKILSSEASKKSGTEAALGAIFVWFVAALLLNDIIAGALYALAAFVAGFLLLLYYPAIKKKNYAKRVEAQLPFILLDIAIELNLGIDFMLCLKHAAKQGGEAAAEFRKTVTAIERQGATVQEAMLQMAARVNSRMLNRSIVQLVAAFEQGAKQAAGEPIKKIAAEILSKQKIESKLFAGKLVVLSLLFIAISAIVPALFQSFTIVGSMVLKTQFTAAQAFLIIVLLFPLLDLLVLFYIKSKTPVFLRG